MKADVKRRSNGRCWYCGAEGSETDHRTPPNQDGINDRSNAAWACRDCNAEKKGEGISGERMWNVPKYKAYVAGQLRVPLGDFTFYLGRLKVAEQEAAEQHADESTKYLILHGLAPELVTFPDPFDWPRTGITRRGC